ncbi:MAG TPA: rhodanese-like domain-containing protein [Nevskiaceae bacterium]|nr:rhodanese-like domain-containing protein [Nevskiaceae bacterium]
MTTIHPLIDAAELQALPAAAVRIVDCRSVLRDPTQGRPLFLDAHIPGAVHADLDHDLSDLSVPGQGRHPLPDAQNFAAALGRWGWSAGQTLVCYDAAGASMAAARLWWMLGAVGIAARVLDGGWQSWLALGFATEAGESRVVASPAPTLAWDRSRMVDYATLDTLRRQREALVIDARGAVRFRGESEPIDRIAGHVPGACNRPIANNLDADSRFKPAERLHEEFRALLAGRDPRQVVHMCGSGVFACQSQLAMEIAGLHGSRVFVPSWSGWSSDPARPVATGG